MTSQNKNKNALNIASDIIRFLDESKKKNCPFNRDMKSDFSFYFFDAQLLETVSQKTVNALAGKALRENLIGELLFGIAKFDDQKVVRRMEKLLNTIKMYEKSIELHQWGKSSFEDYVSVTLNNSMAVNTHALYPDFFLIWRPYMTEFGRQSRDLLKVIRKISDKS